MITDSLAGILLLIYVRIIVYIVFILCIEIAYMREGISALRMYVAVTFPYSRDRGVTHGTPREEYLVPYNIFSSVKHLEHSLAA